jgi:uncharacterized protein (DUF362 family)
MSKRVSRRDSLRWLLLSGSGAALAACGGAAPPAPAAGRPNNGQPSAGETGTEPEESETQVIRIPEKSPPEPAVGQAYMSVARGEDPTAITEAAIQALGGMERFVRSGYDVIIKPNVCTNYHTFEYAATTNPQVLAALVKLAIGAGAKRVRVMDYPFGGSPESAYERSGIAAAVKAAGGEMEVMNRNKYKMTPIPGGKSIQEWEMYQEALTCDLLINVPIAKHHSLARLTLGGKNLMGLIQRRSAIHSDMGQRIADLVSVFRPGLTVVDAVRTLMANGPTGGSLNDVQVNNTVIASHDIVAADSYATGFFNLSGADIAYIRAAADMGLGEIDLKAIKIEEITL